MHSTVELAHVACIKKFNIQPQNSELYNCDFHKVAEVIIIYDGSIIITKLYSTLYNILYYS